MQIYTDQELIKEIAPKDKKSALSLIYQRYFTTVYRFAYSRCGNKQVAEDITSETFIIFWQVMENFQPGSKLSSFLIGIALNKLRQHYQNWNTQTRNIDENYAEAVDLTDYSEQEEQTSRAEVTAILQKLPERYAQILTLRYIENLSTAEIAAAMKLSIANIRQLQSRALKKASQLNLTKQ